MLVGIGVHDVVPLVASVVALLIAAAAFTLTFLRRPHGRRPPR